MNKIRYIGLLTIVLGLAIAVSSCGASRRVITSEGGSFRELSKREFMREYQARRVYPVVDSRGVLTLWTEGRAEDININGVGMRWSLERDKAFELSLRPMNIMEIGRLVVADNRLLVLDRMNKVAFLEEDILRSLRSMFTTVGIDPLILKAVVQNDPFGFVSSGADALERMRFVRKGETYVFTDQLRPGGSRIVHTFDAALNLVSSSIHIPNKAEVLVSNYEFILLSDEAGRRPIPTRIQMEVKTQEQHPQHLLLHFGLQGVSEKTSARFATEIPSGYRRITLADVIELLKNI